MLLLMFVSALLNQMSLHNMVSVVPTMSPVTDNVTVTTSDYVTTEDQSATSSPVIVTTLLATTDILISQTALTNASLTSTLTLASTVPQTTLQCLRGVLLNTGDCLCPDEWTGDTCNISNFCPEETVNGLTFPLTVVGQLRNSTELCPINDSIPMASARCLNSTNTFGDFKLNCVLTLESLQSKINMTGNSVDQNWFIASNVQMLTSKPDQLTSENITSAAGIVCNLLSSSLNETIALAVVGIVSQLMEASPSQYSEDSYTAVENLTMTLENFALRMSMNDSTSGALVQPNLAIQYIKLPSGTSQVQFNALTGLSKAFTPDSFSLGTEAANTTSSESPEVQLTLSLQKDPKNNWENQNVGVGVVLYDNDKFFKPRNFTSHLNAKRRVVSASLTDRQRLDKVEFTIRPKNIPGLKSHSSACVFWDYTQRDWSTDGCYKILCPSGGVECKCNHTTNFAVLMSYRADYQYSEALNWISIVGCSLSLVGLILTALYQIKTRNSRGTNSTMLLVNICVCMTMFYLLFIFGISNPNSRKNSTPSKNVVLASDWSQEVDQGPCTTITALLQYFLLATFTWNIMYAAHVFFLIKNGLKGPPSGFRAFAITAGWGLPALIVGVSLGTTYSYKDPLGYRQEEFCWLASLDKEGRFDPKRPMLWGFLLPLAAMLSFNVGILVYFSFTICCANRNLKSSRTTPLKKKVLSSFSLAVVLGLSWVTGYFVLVTHEKTMYIIVSVIFCLCNTTQGVQIFIFFTLKPFMQKRRSCNLASKTESKMDP